MSADEYTIAILGDLHLDPRFMDGTLIYIVATLYLMNLLVLTVIFFPTHDAIRFFVLMYIRSCRG